MTSNTSAREALQWGTARLKKARVDSPALDAELLLVHAIKALHLSSIEDKCNGCVAGRAWLYAHSEQQVSRTARQQYRKFIARRARREPVAYIVGHKEFYGLDCVVNKHVLVPRPESELLVDEVKKQITRYTLHGTRYAIVDVGTGSGAIIVLLVKQLGVAHESARRRELSLATPRVQFFATDISAEALRVARANARRHGVEKQITFVKGNLLEPLLKNAKFRMKNVEWLMVANLPYLKTSEWRATMPEVRKYEPRGALDGGRDGLKYYREMFEQIECKMKNVKCKMAVLCEICPEQAVPFKKMARGYFPSAKIEVVKDLSRKNRVMVVKI